MNTRIAGLSLIISFYFSSVEVGHALKVIPQGIFISFGSSGGPQCEVTQDTANTAQASYKQPLNAQYVLQDATLALQNPQGEVIKCKFQSYDDLCEAVCMTDQQTPSMCTAVPGAYTQSALSSLNAYKGTSITLEYLGRINAGEQIDANEGCGCPHKKKQRYPSFKRLYVIGVGRNVFNAAAGAPF